jgi:type III secretory pathway component EscV
VPPGADGAAVEATIVAHVLPLVSRRAADLLGISDTQRLLDQVERAHPGLVRQVVPARLTLPVLTEVLRRLVEEQVSIRDLAAVLEALALAPSPLADPVDLAEGVRARLGPQRTFELTRGGGTLPVLVLDRMLEDSIEEAVQTTPAGRFVSLAPAAARDIAEAVERALADHPDAVLLTRPDVRRFVRKVLESRLPDLRVVSFAELSPDVALETRATVTLYAN